MAKATIRLPEKFLLQLSQLGNKTDDIVPKVLEAGSEVVLSEVRSGLKAVLSGQSTGELESALGVSPAMLDRDGNYNVKVGFSEPRSGGGSNAMIASVLEYGRSGQPPRPFIKPAIIASRSAAIAAMKDRFREEVGKL